VGYSIYDFLATALLAGLFANKLLPLPLIPLLAVQLAGRTRIMGGGDVFLLSLFTLVLLKIFGARRAGLFVVGELPVVLCYNIVANTLRVNLPLSPFLVVPFVIAAWMMRAKG